MKRGLFVMLIGMALLGCSSDLDKSIEYEKKGER